MAQFLKPRFFAFILFSSSMLFSRCILFFYLFSVPNSKTYIRNRKGFLLWWINSGIRCINVNERRKICFLKLKTVVMFFQMNPCQVIYFQVQTKPNSNFVAVSNIIDLFITFTASWKIWRTKLSASYFKSNCSPQVYWEK